MDSKAWQQRPSQRMPPPPPYRVWNDWAAWQFDQAILYGGLTIEHALQEREPVGDPQKHETRAKYTLKQVLAPGYKLKSRADEDRPRDAQGRGLGPLEAFMGQIQGLSGAHNPHVRFWRVVEPEVKQNGVGAHE